MFWSSVSTDAAGREVRKAPSRENIKEIRTNIARYGADACNGPNRLTQCVPNSNPLGIIFFVSGISISFKCECHIIIQMQYTKNLNPGRFELGTTLSQPIRSIVRSPHRLPAPRIVYYFVPSARKGTEVVERRFKNLCPENARGSCYRKRSS